MNQEATLLPTQTFGWKPDVVGNGVLLQDNRIAFISGKLLVLYNEEDHSQEIAQCDEKSFSTAFAISPNRKLIAVGQYSPKDPAFVELFTVPFTKKTVLKADVILSNVCANSTTLFYLLICIFCFSYCFYRKLLHSLLVQTPDFLLHPFLMVIQLLLSGISVKKRFACLHSLL